MQLLNIAVEKPEQKEVTNLSAKSKAKASDDVIDDEEVVKKEAKLRKSIIYCEFSTIV